MVDQEQPLRDSMADRAAQVQDLLGRLLPPVAGPRGRVIEAMRYSALSGGKRLRPYLLVETAALFDVPEEQSLRAACALEMIHCYSLIHDDLPAMDDSDLRRGAPTVHKTFDEAVAILAGDGLLTEAFAVLAAPETHPKAEVRAALVAQVALAAGAAGMVGGQMIDISAERAGLDLSGIRELQSLKTGALIAVSCEAGAIMGEANPEERDGIVSYAKELGLAFQIADDLLDARSTAEELGKPTGQDEALGKATFVGQLGIDGAERLARQTVDQAVAHLAAFGPRAARFREIAEFVVDRRV